MSNTPQNPPPPSPQIPPTLLQKLTEGITEANRALAYNLFLGIVTGLTVYIETGFSSISFSLGLVMFMVLLQFEHLSIEAKLRRQETFMLHEHLNDLRLKLYNHTHRIDELVKEDSERSNQG